VMFVHPWSWAIMLLFLAVFGLLLGFRGTGSFSLNPGLRAVLSVLILNTTLGIAGAALVFPTFWILPGVLASPGFGVGQVMNFGFNLRVALSIDFGGFYTFPLLALLSVIGYLSLHQGSSFSKLLTAWLIVGSLLFPFMEFKLQTRLLFTVPFQILAARGLEATARFFGGDRRTSKLLHLGVFLVSLTYSLRALSNLVVL
ncbi:MAG: hypothetical protein ACE5KH_05455, partial [Candidatus Geothermarchaeales archaeon]